MIRCLTFAISALALGLSPLRAAERTFHSPHPNLTWDGEHADENQYRVEVWSEEVLLITDSVRRLTRFVPSTPLADGDYRLRVFEKTGEADEALLIEYEFSVELRDRSWLIPAGSGMKKIVSTLSKAKRAGGGVVRFETGTYRVKPNDGEAVFKLENARNIIIDGQGSTIIVESRSGVLELEHCTSVVLRDFSIDYDPLPNTAFMIQSVDTESGTFDCAVLPGHPLPESDLKFMAEKIGMLIDPAFPRLAENRPILNLVHPGPKALGGGRYQFTLQRTEEIRFFEPGLVYKLGPRGPMGFHLKSSKDVTLFNLTTYMLPGIGVSSHFTDELKILRVSFLNRQGRVLGVQNGGTNLHNARIGPWMEGCVFENTGDDNNHINAVAFYAHAQPAPNQLLFRRVQPFDYGSEPLLGLAPGDRMQFFDYVSAIERQVNSVASVERKEANVVLVTFEDPIDQVVLLPLGNKPKRDDGVTRIYNLDRSCGHFAFRNNTFRRGRRIGILTRSGPGLIAGNQFEDLGGGGVEMWDAPFEGPHGFGITIENNRFARNGIAYSKQGWSAALWLRSFGDDDATAIRHRDIVIRGNRFVDYYRHAISLNHGRDILIEGNVFENREMQEYRHEDSRPIEILHSEHVRVRENVMKDDRLEDGEPAVRVESSRSVDIEAAFTD